MMVVITISIIISYFLLQTISNNFSLLKGKFGALVGVLFTLGIYFTATGNGAHEIASFAYNTFCDTKTIENKLCRSLFFNDYYFGNIVYFIGLLLGNISLILLERKNALKKTTRNQTIITVTNGILYALALTAYAAFDRVLVGLGFVIIAAITVNFFLLTARKNAAFLPFTLYCSLGYTASALLSIFIRYYK